MEIKFDVFFTKNLGTIYKDNSIDLDGIDAVVDLDLSQVNYIHINFEVGNESYTDTVVIKDIENKIVQIPFKTDVLKQGINQFELVATMKNGDVKPSQTCKYYIEKSLENPNSIQADTNYPVLIQLIDSVEENIKKIDTAIANIPPKEELKGEKGDKGDQGLQGIQGEKGQDGITPNVQIGTVSTLEEGQNATVTRTGTIENPILNFAIPRGNTGGKINDTTISKVETWSSSKIEDFVLTNDDVTWTTLEGQNLSVNYTKEGYLREIEIWGNTIQSSTDLSDIKHLGELYVDDLGQPILDELGREQYKIEIESCNKNLFNYDYVIGYMDNKGNPLNGGTYDGFRTTGLIKVLKGKTYYFRNFTNLQGIPKTGSRLLEFNKEKDVIGNNIKITSQYSVTENCEYIKLSFNCRYNDGVYDQANPPLNTDFKFSMSFEELLTYTPHQSHKTTILLPCQLSKVGDVYDRLYWDSEKGKYIVEKNVYEVDFNSYTLKDKTFNELTTHCRQLVNLPYTNVRDKIVICNKLKSKVTWNEEIDNIYATDNSLGMMFMIPKSQLNEISSNGCIEWIKNNNIIAYYILLNPQLIETNITEPILLPTYKDKTHIFVTGGIDGSIKAKVPLDGGTAILSLSEENQELQVVNENQDELINTTMLATDEMYMMIEPLLVQTYSLLSDEGGVSKMVDLYVAMVQRGLKTIEEVPIRYREQVAEVLRQLEE